GVRGDLEPGDVVTGGAERLDHGVRVPRLDGGGDGGDASAEAVDAAQLDDAGERRGHDVAEHGAGLDRGELARVADEDQAGGGAHRVEQAGHERQAHHRALVDDHDVVGQLVRAVVAEPAVVVGAPAEQAV